MGAGFHGGFGGTKGGTSIYSGISKSYALSSVSSLPKEIQGSAKSFFRGDRIIRLGIRKIAQKLNLANATVKRWTTIPKAECFELQETRAHYLDSYKEFILEQLRICQQIKTINRFYKTKEDFSDFDCPRTAFSRYIKALREDYGYSRFSGRQTEPCDALPPGYEAQVDFGQSKLLDMYGRTVRVYFFYMILSYSRMKDVYIYVFCCR